MGDEKAPSVQKSTARTVASVKRNLPYYTDIANQQILPIEQAKLEATQQISPEYQQLLTQLYGQYAPKLAQIGAQTEDINRRAAADTDLGILNNSGAAISSAYRSADQALNPEYFANRAQLSNSLGQLLALNDLSRPNIEAERLVSQEEARSGNAGTPSATSTLANALSFGNEGIKRQNQLSQAIAIGSAMLPNIRSSFDPAANALTRGSSNAGQSQFLGNREIGNEAFGAAQDLLNTSTGLQATSMNINANRRDPLDRVNETFGSTVGSVC